LVGPNGVPAGTDFGHPEGAHRARSLSSAVTSKKQLGLYPRSSASSAANLPMIGQQRPAFLLQIMRMDADRPESKADSAPGAQSMLIPN